MHSQYSSVENEGLLCPTSGTSPATAACFDFTMMARLIFYHGFDGYASPNVQTPYVTFYPQYAKGSAVLARYDVAAETFDFQAAPFDRDFLAPGLSSES